MALKQILLKSGYYL